MGAAIAGIAVGLLFWGLILALYLGDQTGFTLVCAAVVVFMVAWILERENA